MWNWLILFKFIFQRTRKQLNLSPWMPYDRNKMVPGVSEGNSLIIRTFLTVVSGVINNFV